MPKFYKKGPLGRMVEAEGGSSDPELAEVRMTPKEYKGLYDQIHAAQKEAAHARSAADSRISDIKEKAREKIESVRRQAEVDAEKKAAAAQAAARMDEQETADLRKRLEEARGIIQNEKHLNTNLIRIMRERANQVRGLKPKKQHDGYLVLESRQWKEKYKVDVWDTEDHRTRYGGNPGVARKKGYLRTEHMAADAWKSILQTPYDVRIPLAQARYRIEEDLFEKDILRGIGCTGMHDGYEVSAFDRNENILYMSVFKANYRSRMWELEIYTTNELIVPEYRLPPLQKTRKTEEKSRKPKQPVLKAEGTGPRGNANSDLKVVDDPVEWDEDDENFFDEFDSM